VTPAVLGVGMTRFGRQPERSAVDLAAEAIRQAVAHAGVSLGDVQALFCGTLYLRPGMGQQVAAALGLAGKPVVNVDNACASSTSGMREAMAWIGAGEIDLALCIGVETMSTTNKGPLKLDVEDPIGGSGMVMPAEYAFKGARYLEEYPEARAEDFAAVAVKSRRHAALNPRAHFQTEVTLEEVLGSPPIVDPLTLFQCCPKSDGASAAIIGSEKAAKRFGGMPVFVRSSVTAAGGLRDRSDADRDTTSVLAPKAYEAAGIGPVDVDVAEVQDPFTIAEVIYTESLGLVPRGEGAVRAARGETSLGGGGRVVVNPDGGLLSRGHPLGATGLAQVAEIVWQLRGEAGDRQVEGAKVGLQHSAGLSVMDLEFNGCFVQVYSR
jgi:acetyl-CoA acetyltransferase